MMALQHFLNCERLVRLGGVTIKLFRLTHHFGGRDYVVKPLSVHRFIVLLNFLKPFMSKENKKFDEMIYEMIDVLPAWATRTLIPLLAGEDVEMKDIKRTNKQQLKALWYAFLEVNDLDFILKFYNFDEASKKNELAMDFSDYALFLCERLYGVRLPHEFLNLPLQYFFALMEGFKRLDNIRDGIPADAERLTEQEKTKVKNVFQSLGVTVH